MSKTKIELGDIAKDSITGYEGVVVGRSVALHNCDRLTLQSRGVKDGKPIDSRTFDEMRVAFVQKGGHGVTPAAATAIECGDEVEDPITGLKGIVISSTTWSEGCVVVAVQPPELKDGVPVDSTAFDARKLVVTKPARQRPKAVKTGGPRPEPPRRGR